MLSYLIAVFTERGEQVPFRMAIGNVDLMRSVGKHRDKSYTFPIAILNGTCSLWNSKNEINE